MKASRRKEVPGKSTTASTINEVRVRVRVRVRFRQLTLTNPN